MTQGWTAGVPRLERQAPDANQTFLVSLGMAADELATIRAWPLEYPSANQMKPQSSSPR